MRFLLLFLLLFSAPIQARNFDQELRVLGPIEVKRLPARSGYNLPTGAMVKLISVGKDSIVVEREGRQYEMDRERAEFYLEGGAVGTKFLLGEALKKLPTLDLLLAAPGCVELPGAAATNCAWSNGRGVVWDADATRKSILSCPTERVSILRRIDTNDRSDVCRNTEAVLDSTKGQWISCQIPPTCNAQEQELLRRQELWRKSDAIAVCTSVPKTAPKQEREPRCVLSFQQPIRRIVVHQTDAPSDRGANVVYNWHRGRGYNDVGYHYIISKDINGKWMVVEGRPRAFEGAHGGPGANNDSLAIAIAGCYRTGPPSPTKPCKEEDRPPAEAVRLLTNLVAQLKEEIKGPDGRPSIREITGHGEHRFEHTSCHTDCPSPACQMLVNRLRERFFPKAEQ